MNFQIILIYNFSFKTQDLLTKKDKEENREKFLIYECNKEGCAGWADRLKGIFSNYDCFFLCFRVRYLILLFLIYNNFY
jgi:hypothetical protein